MLAEPLAHEILDLAAKASSPVRSATTKAFTTWPRSGVGHADGRRFAHLGMLQDRVLDLDGAHRPAGRDDDVVGAAAVIEVALLVGAPEILGGDPAGRAATPSARPSRRAGSGLPLAILHLDRAARDGLAERAGLDDEIRGARIAHQDHADLGGAVHAAGRPAERLLDERRRLAVDRLAGEGKLLQGVAVAGAAPELRIMR